MESIQSILLGVFSNISLRFVLPIAESRKWNNCSRRSQVNVISCVTALKPTVTDKLNLKEMLASHGENKASAQNLKAFRLFQLYFIL